MTYQNILRVVVAVSSIVLTACSIKTAVKPAAEELSQGDRICVEVNQKVTEPDILRVIEQSIIDNGFVAETYTQVPVSCEYKLTYVAYRKWDFSTFLSKANITLYKGNRVIGNISYETPNGIFGGGGINPSKWDSTEEKISPLMRQLLTNS